MSTDDGDQLSDDDDSFLRGIAGMGVAIPPVSLASGELVNGTYRIVAAAGQGGMGAVYRARDEVRGRDVAIKVLHRPGGAQRRFEREAAILDDLDHPGIVRYVERGTLEGGAPFLVMEWIEGDTLDRCLRGAAALTVEQTLALARRIAAGLGFAHARGVVHRDVKPSNIICPGGDPAQATLLDFGIARAFAPEGSLTETGAVLGTPSYMAPEQLRAARDIGPRADVFALGCVLHECLTGRRAFEARRLLALRAKVLLVDPPRLRTLAPHVPAGLEALVARAVDKHPARRPADGDEFLAGLDTPPDDAPPAARAAPEAIVIAAPAEALDPAGASSLHTDSLETLRGQLGDAVDVLQDGAIIATAALADALEQARMIRRAAPQAVVGVVSGAGDLGAVIDELCRALARDGMTLLFDPAAPHAGCIRLDARIAALADAADLVTIKDTTYLR